LSEFAKLLSLLSSFPLSVNFVGIFAGLALGVLLGGIIGANMPDKLEQWSPARLIEGAIVQTKNSEQKEGPPGMGGHTQ
jgi:hypothetical protein